MYNYTWPAVCTCKASVSFTTFSNTWPYVTDTMPINNTMLARYRYRYFCSTLTELFRYLCGTFTVLLAYFNGTSRVLTEYLRGSTITSTVTFVHFFLSATVHLYIRTWKICTVVDSSFRMCNVILRSLLLLLLVSI